jgi:hypothetical protein
MKLVFRIVLAVSLAVLGNVVSNCHADDENWTSLFNGKDLTGWVLVNTPADTWTVQDGMLICSGKPIGEIRTERMYQNFILEAEWRHMVPRGNAGIFVWADDITAKGVPFHRSVEVQVLENAYGQSQHHTTHGDIFPIHGAKMTPLNGRGGNRAFPTEERSKPSPEWNHYRVECNNGDISLAVNGKAVTQGTQASPRKGYICIESEGGVVHYRNMRIQVLSDTPVADEDVAIANRGYRSLYSGLDLRGWTTSNEGQQHWKVNDWILSYDGEAADGVSATLTSSVALQDQGFLLDLKPKEGFGGLSICSLKLPPQLTKSGEWHRIEGSVTSGMLTVSVDGRLVSEGTALPDSSVFALSVTGPADFANIYVRNLADKPQP